MKKAVAWVMEWIVALAVLGLGFTAIREWPITCLCLLIGVPTVGMFALWCTDSPTVRMLVCPQEPEDRGVALVIIGGALALVTIAVAAVIWYGDPGGHRPHGHDVEPSEFTRCKVPTSCTPKREEHERYRWHR